MKKFRMERNLTQENVANALGFSRSVYSQYERDEREPSVSRLIAISRFFMVSLDSLCDNTEYEFYNISKFCEEDKTVFFNILKKYD